MRSTPKTATRRALLLLAAPLVLLAACEALDPPSPRELDLWVAPAAGVESEELARLCTSYWESWLEAHPVQATYLGDPRYDDRVPNVSLRGREERTKALREQQSRWRAVGGDELSPTDRTTWELLGQELDKELEALAVDVEGWTVDPLEGPHVRLLNLTSVQPRRTRVERENLVERWSRWALYTRQLGRNLLSGKRNGRISSRTAIEKSIAQLDKILRTPLHESPLIEVATGGGHWIELASDGSVAKIAHDELGDAREQRTLRLVNKHLQDGERLAIGTKVLIPAADDPLTPEERGDFLYAVLQTVEGEVYPAFAGYRDLLANELFVGARPDSEPGLVHVPGGAGAYRALIHAQTSLPREECDPEDLHQFGLDEVRRIRAEIAELGQRVFGTGDVAEIQRRLRFDPELHFRTRDEVQAKAEEALARARARMPEFFDLLPHADCIVVRIPPHEEADTTIAYYNEPAADGSRPGRYFINTYEPETRPRYEAEVLAYHEAIPGHHLQIAIAQERTDLPLFRRYLGSTAFVEGWALYTERLADEMGLYSADLDRLGMLSFDAWRASRLVVDTGIHALGWSRERAIEFLFDNSLLARNNVENEVDRYIAWPGQALAYKTGQRELLTLRDEARRVLGSSFSYPRFHDAVLENGAVSLETLRRVVRESLGLPPALEAEG